MNKIPLKIAQLKLDSSVPRSTLEISYVGVFFLFLDSF